MTMSIPDKVVVDLTRKDALVLFEYLRRCDDAESYSFADQVEQRVLWNLECVLEKSLHEIFDPNYGNLLTSAWDEIRDPE